MQTNVLPFLQLFVQIYLADHRYVDGHEREARTCSYKYDTTGYGAYAAQYNKIADLLRLCEECGLASKAGKFSTG
jgi:hypothetical protein